MILLTEIFIHCYNVNKQNTVHSDPTTSYSLNLQQTYTCSLFQPCKITNMMTSAGYIYVFPSNNTKLRSICHWTPAHRNVTAGRIYMYAVIMMLYSMRLFDTQRHHNIAQDTEQLKQYTHNSHGCSSSAIGGQCTLVNSLCSIIKNNNT